MEPKSERWSRVALTAVVVLIAAWLMMPPRYEMHVSNDALFRFDRWSGHVDASALKTLRRASWATVVLSESEEKDLAR